VVKQRLILLTLVLLLLSGSAAKAFEPISVPGLDNFQSVSEQLYRGAKPSDVDLQVLQQSGVKCIINLRHRSSNEEASSQRLGLKYFHIPMGWFKSPSPETVRKFLTIVSNPQNQPAYIHCYQGADRTGTMVAIYRIMVQNWGFHEAYKEMRRHHFKPMLASLRHTVFRYSAQPITAASRDELAVKTDKLLVTGGVNPADFVKLGM
jgi:protein tyrosine/serine phosphatase